MQWTCWGSTAGAQSLGFLGVVHGHERNKPGLYVVSYGRSYHMAKLPSSERVGAPAGGSRALKACLWLNAHPRSLGPHRLLAVCTGQSQTAS